MSALSACVQKALKPLRFLKQRAHHLLCALEARTVSALSACVCAIFCDCEGAINTSVGILRCLPTELTEYYATNMY